MKCVITGNKSVLHGPFPITFITVISTLNGKKNWKNSSQIEFESIPSNLKKLKSSGHDIEFIDEGHVLVDLEEFENLPSQVAQVSAVKTDYRPKLPLREYQQKALNLSAERKAYAYFLSMGLGKSAIVIANIGMLVMANKLTGVLILSPRGVHSQWVNEQFKDHFDDRIKYKAHIWSGMVPDLKRGSEQLTVLSMNIDSIRTKKGFDVAYKFLKDHSNFSMIVIDESHAIKSGTAQRTKAAWQLGSISTYRRILTGTPISKNVGDMWSQFRFLDERILGHRYFTSFRAQYLILGGFEGRQVIGSKNIEELYRCISPHSFRMTKEEALDLPEKIYVKRPYVMSEITAQHYKSLKNSFITMLSDGSVVDVNNAISCLLRLQQVLSGYLPNESGDFETFSNDRMDQLMEIVNQTEGPTIIWSRFTNDVLRITEKLNEEFGKGSAVAYFGGNVKDRGESVRAFVENDARFFVSNPAAGGVGLNLQGSGCKNVIYFSNNFNLIERLQSEDRVHRLGMKNSVTYFDIVAERSIDKTILTNLRNKKSVSSMTLDEIRKSLKEE